jgi:sugar phosphate isomerase/epimerase
VKLLLHTIALEPARWTPQRVSQALVDLIPKIAQAGFNRLEVYEPHLAAPADAEAIKASLAKYQLEPVILSSYLNVNPAETNDADLDAAIEVLAQRVEFFGFSKIRFFAGSRMSPKDPAAPGAFSERIARVAKRLPNTELLIEAHDGSLADDFELITKIVEDLKAQFPNVGLLYQPTLFDAENSLKQLGIQKHLIRHIHLQNRNPDLSFATLNDGKVPWREILAQLSPEVEGTIEFVPVGICKLEEFDLDATIAQAQSEAAWVNS